MKKRIFSLLLCLLILAASGTLLASCENEARERGSYTWETPEWHYSSNDPNIPAVDYEKYIFSYLTTETVDFVFAESESEEYVMDSVYRRNLALSDKYNISFAQILSPDVVADVRAQSNSGTVFFDVVMASGTDMALLARERLLYNLNDLEWVDMTKPYWDANAARDLAVGEALYVAAGDFTLPAPYALFFNDTIVETYSLPSPYTDVENNEWTLDTLNRLLKSFSAKEERNGLIGLAFEHGNAAPLLYASDIRATTANGKGSAAFTLTEKQASLAYDKLKAIAFDSASVFCSDCASEAATEAAYADHLFIQGQALFRIAPLSAADRFAEMEDECGVLPLPKFDAAQSEYRSLMPSASILFGCPAALPDPDRTGRILEDLGYYSMVIVAPNWYDCLLRPLGENRSQAEDCGVLIRKSAVYDMGLLLDFGGLRTKLLDLDPAKTDFAELAALQSAVEADINDTYAKFNAVPTA